MPLTRSVPSAKPDGSSGFEVQVAAHARGRVDHHVDAAVAQPLDDLAVERHLARAVAGARIPHVDVHDGGAGPRRLDAGLGDLLAA